MNCRNYWPYFFIRKPSHFVFVLIRSTRLKPLSSFENKSTGVPRIYLEKHYTTVKLHAVFSSSPRLNQTKKKNSDSQFEEVEEARFFIFVMLTLNNCDIRWNMPFDAELTLNFLRVWCTLYISWSSPSPTYHLSSFSSQNSHHILKEEGLLILIQEP